MELGLVVLEKGGGLLEVNGKYNIFNIESWACVSTFRLVVIVGVSSSLADEQPNTLWCLISHCI